MPVDYGVAVPVVGYTTVPSTVPDDWPVEPVCGVFAVLDGTFATSLSGVQNVGTYVTHCSGGSSAAYAVPEYKNGSFTISQNASSVVNHVHPDHVPGLPALPWLSDQARQQPLNVAGPTGSGSGSSACIATRCAPQWPTSDSGGVSSTRGTDRARATRRARRPCSAAPMDLCPRQSAPGQTWIPRSSSMGVPSRGPLWSGEDACCETERNSRPIRLMLHTVLSKMLVIRRMEDFSTGVKPLSC